MKALVGKSLLEHADIYVKVSIVSCISQVFIITAPDEPYCEEFLMVIFKLIVVAFEKLSDASDCCYSKAVNILENAARVRFCVLLLDLELEALIIEIFEKFLSIIRADHPQSVFHYMENVMTWIIKESDDISPELLKPILASLKRDNQNASPISSRLGAQVLRNCDVVVKPYLKLAMKMMSLNFDDYAEIVAAICKDSLQPKNVDVKESPVDLKPEKLNDIGDGQQAYGARTLPRERASEEPALGNAVVKIEEGIFSEAEEKQELLLQQGDETNHVNKQSTFDRHATEKLGGEVSVSPMKRKRKRGPPKKEEYKKRCALIDYGGELVGLRINVWWPMDRRFYDGVVSSFDPSTKKHRVLYSDGDEENLNLHRQRWELLDDGSTDKDQKVDAQSPAISSSKCSRSGGCRRKQKSS